VTLDRSNCVQDGGESRGARARTASCSREHPIEVLWSNPKGVELANLTGDNL
jgi:hypothetical protein